MILDIKEFKNKKVIVTGSSTGIGFETGIEFLELGANVVFHGNRSIEDLDDRIKKRTANHNFSILKSDFTNLNEVENFMKSAIKELGGLNILINNAGYGRWGELTSHERDDYSKMLQLNVTTLTDLCHLYIPDMVTQGGGGIINVGSMASLLPIPYASVYSSSKAYVLMFSEAIRYEYQKKGIKVMALLPGGTESEFASVATEKSEKLTKRYQKREDSAAGVAMQTSLEVANECLEAFEKNKQYVLCGGRNRFLYNLTRIMSRQRVLEMTGGIFKKIAG